MLCGTRGSLTSCGKCYPAVEVISCRNPKMDEHLIMVISTCHFYNQATFAGESTIIGDCLGLAIEFAAVGLMS